MSESKEKEDLFNNPMVKSAMAAMTPEQLEDYKIMGKHMHSIDFTEEIPRPKDLEQETVNGVFYIKDALKSGLHPRDMTTKEIQLMYDVYGKDWFREYGYKKNEVPCPPVVTVNDDEAPFTNKQIRNLEKKLKKKKEKRKGKKNRRKK